MISRRRFLGGALGAGVLAGCSSDPGQGGQLLRSKASLPEPFQVPLTQPPVLAPGAGGRVRLAARAAEQELLPGLHTPVLGYDGIFPGPTLEVTRGRPVALEYTSDLPVPTVVHLHGGTTPAASDGFPTDLVQPGATRTYDYPLDQRAATLWYHDHRMDFTGPAVYRGLAGFMLIRDDEEDRLDLPRDERELVLMVTDRAFHADGTLDYPAMDVSMTGMPGVRDDYVEGVTGDVVLVNGRPWPSHEVGAARHRLRWLNASNSRRYRLRLDPPPPGGGGFVRIGTDGGLLASAAGSDVLTLAPGERVDALVDFGRYPVGSRVTVRNDLGRGPTAGVMRFVVARRAADASRPVTAGTRLSEIEPLSWSAATPRRRFRFRRGVIGEHRGWLINDEPFDPDRPVARVPAGRTEVWRMVTDIHHPVHLHLAPFQLAGQPEAGWKDTVDLLPGQTADLVVRFPDHPGRYVLHCHNLEHEDMAMMARFDVV